MLLIILGIIVLYYVLQGPSRPQVTKISINLPSSEKRVDSSRIKLESTIQNYLQKSSEEKLLQEALRKLKHCHLFDPRESKCSRCGMTVLEYESKPPYQQERCPNARYEDFVNKGDQ